MAKNLCFPNPCDLAVLDGYPDMFTFFDGERVLNADDWSSRAEELRAMYQKYMYGVWRDGSDEKLTYTYSQGKLSLEVERISTGARSNFTATVRLPDSCAEVQDCGYPCIVGMHQGISESVANSLGFATITIDGFSIPVAGDNTQHTGAFYELYPYTSVPEEQTGVLMAWGWGCSKVLDALYQGLGGELKINPDCAVVTGVSRWGKAALVCGAFDTRFKVTMPSCSGAGGAALYRYKSEGRTYDFSSKGAPAAYTYGKNEPLSCLQSDGERGWFNDAFTQFESPYQLPLEQYMLAALTADAKRYLYIIGSCISEDWVNAPAMWYCWREAKRVFELLDVPNNTIINIHKEGHAVIGEDVEKLFEYLSHMEYGMNPEFDVSVMQTSVFELEVNADKGFLSDGVRK